MRSRDGNVNISMYVTRIDGQIGWTTQLAGGIRQTCAENKSACIVYFNVTCSGCMEVNAGVCIKNELKNVFIVYNVNIWIHFLIIKTIDIPEMLKDNKVAKCSPQWIQQHWL